MEKTSGILQLEINNEYFILERNQNYLLGKQIHSNCTEVNCTNIICLKNEQLDMKHCLIEVSKNGEIFLIDLCSMSGTFVNGQRLQGLKKLTLNCDDVIKLADQIIRISKNKIDEGDSSGFLESNKSLSNCNSHSLHEGQFLINNASINTNKSDNSNIVIPETQFVKEPVSYDGNKHNNNCKNDQNATSLKDITIEGKIRLSILDNTNQDCCIPETQEISPEKCDNNANIQEYNNDIRCLNKNSYSHDITTRTASMPTATADVVVTTSSAMTIDAKTTFKVNDEIDVISEGSQFRICTQDFNELNDLNDIDPQIQSQILHIIRDKNGIGNNDETVTNINGIQMEKPIEQQQQQSQHHQQQQHEQKEKSSTEIINVIDEQQNHHRNNMVTPDLSDLENLTPELICDDFLDDCIQDFLETQKYPNPNQNIKITTSANISTDISVNESNKNNPKLKEKVNQTDFKGEKEHSKQDGNILDIKQNQNDDDIDEDDLLTQALLKPTTTESINNNNNNSTDKLIKSFSTSNTIKSTTTTTTIVTSTSTSTPSTTTKITNCHNSTMLDNVSHTNLEKCFDDSAATPTTLKMFNNQSIDNLNKTITMLTPIGLGRTINLPSQDNDVDFLKCTPQIINMHINITEKAQLYVNKLNINTSTDTCSKSEKPTNSIKSLKRNNAKNGDDNDNGNYVTLVKPNDTKDFESLLENLKVQQTIPNIQNNSTGKKAIRHHNNDVENPKSKINKFTMKRLVVKVNQVLKTEAPYLKDTLKKDSLKSNKRNEQHLKNNNRKLIVKLHRINTNNFDFGRFSSSSSSSMSNQKLKSKSKPNQLLNAKKENKLSDTHSRLHLRSSREISTNESNTEDNIPTQPLEHRKSIQDLKKNTSSKMSKNSTNELRTMQKRKVSTNLTTDEIPMKRVKQKELSEDDISTQPLPSTSSKKTHKKLEISTSMIDANIMADLLKQSKGFWSVATDPINSEILVMDKGCRTYKFLLAMAKGTPIVTTHWLRKVNINRKLMPFEDDFLNDSEFEKRYKFSILQSLRQVGRRRKPLFYGYTFAVTSNILPIPQQIKTLVECSGGQVYTYVKTRTMPITTTTTTLHLISCVEDKKDWHLYRRLCKNLIVITTEAIMSAVMQQSVDSLNKHLLH